MRKLLAILLALCLVSGLGISAFAAETVEQKGSKDIEVTAKYASTTSTPAVYSVDIAWSSMMFTYTQTNLKEWNAADHSYNTVSQGNWDKTTATVTVTNHSNVSVNIAMQYIPFENTGVQGALVNATAALQAGEEGRYNSADSMTATLTISGTPSNTVTTEGIKVGTIRITIE